MAYPRPTLRACQAATTHLRPMGLCQAWHAPSWPSGQEGTKGPPEGSRLQFRGKLPHIGADSSRFFARQRISFLSGHPEGGEKADPRAARGRRPSARRWDPAACRGTGVQGGEGRGIGMPLAVSRAARIPDQPPGPAGSCRGPWTLQADGRWRGARRGPGPGRPRGTGRDPVTGPRRRMRAAGPGNGALQSLRRRPWKQARCASRGACRGPGVLLAGRVRPEPAARLQAGDARSWPISARAPPRPGRPGGRDRG